VDKDKLKGKGEEIAGKVEERAGEASGNDDLADRGRRKQVKGAARKAFGGVTDVFDKAKDKAGDAVKDARS
jgi:uncharacterized protein YjbJ (UPF0337 family)